MIKKHLLRLEILERREVFAAFNIPWPEVDQLTLSFVPDGTLVGGHSSQLFSTMNRAFPQADWQREILSAFQTWAVESNINIGLVDDGGEPLNSIGFKQGDVRFGDVRIGAFPMDDDVLAVANPYDPFIANTWVGDVFLNGKGDFLKSAENPAQALHSIMLHESGHVYGISHSADPASPMFPQFQNADRGLTPNDIALLRTLYGSRKSDAWEGATGNQDIAHAVDIPLFNNAGEMISPAWRADVGSLDDVDMYAVQIPADTHALDVRMQASGISLLTAKISVMNDRGEVIAAVAANDPRDNDLILSLNAVHPGETLYIRLSSADADAFGVGAYELQLQPRANPESPPPTDTDWEYHDASGGNIEQVLATTPGYVEHTYYETYADLSPSQPSRVYRVRSADVGSDLTNVFTVVIGAENVPLDELIVKITDAVGRDLPFIVIPGDGEKLALQVTGVASNADYLISVGAKHPLTDKIGFEVEVDFAQDGTHLETYVNDSLDAAQPVVERTLNVVQSERFHFVLGGSDWSSPHESGLEMQITDTAGNVVFHMEVADGAVRTGDVFLDRGEYSVRFSSPHRLRNSQVIFQLSGMTVGSPIGPQLRDTTAAPVDSASASPVDRLTFYWSPGRVDNGTTLLVAPAVITPPSTASAAAGKSNGVPQSPALQSADADIAGTLSVGSDMFPVPSRYRSYRLPTPSPGPVRPEEVAPSIEFNTRADSADYHTLVTEPIALLSINELMTVAAIQSPTSTLFDTEDIELPSVVGESSPTTSSSLVRQVIGWFSEGDRRPFTLAAAALLGGTTLFVRRRRRPVLANSSDDVAEKTARRFQITSDTHS